MRMQQLVHGPRAGRARRRVIEGSGRRRRRPATAAPASRTRPTAPAARRRPRQWNDRVLERRRRRQRLPRGAGLHRQGRGARLRPGAEAHHDPPQHGRGRPAPGHPRPDRRRASMRSSSTRTIPRPSTRRSRRPRRPKSSTVSVDAYVTNPDTYNLYNNQIKYARARRPLAVREAGRREHRLLHARNRRPSGRHRPRHRLQEGPGRISRTSRSSRTRTACTRSGTDHDHPADQLLHR